MTLLKRKLGGLHDSLLLADGNLPSCFGILRWQQECEPRGLGTREFIRVLRPLETAAVADLITQIMEAGKGRQLLCLRGQLGKHNLLILDELGDVSASKAGAEPLLDVISTACERQRLIVTTNLSFENGTEWLVSERLTGAMLDGLSHRCHLLETGGDSCRLRDAKRHQETGQKTEDWASLEHRLAG